MAFLNLSRRASIAPTIAAVLVVLLWWGAWDNRPLARPDEGRYAEISREMLQSGDFITPRLNGIKYFEKPPLQYWATAVAYQVAGKNEYSARFWTIFCGFLSLLFSAWLARGLGVSRSTSWLAPVILAGALYPSLLGHVNTLDSGVTAFLTGAIAAFVQAKRSPRSAYWMALSGGLLGLAVLSKGLIGIVLPGIAMVFYTLCTLNFSAWKRVHLFITTLSLLAIAAPWFVMCSLQNPEFAHFFFIHEHFERFTSTVHQRVEPVWYFLPILIIGFLPWALLLPQTLFTAWKHSVSSPDDFRPGRFLLIYAMGIIAFFSASGSKLPTYILPAFPALAALLALHLTHVQHSAKHLLGLGGFALGGLFLAAGLLLGFPEQSIHQGIPLDLDPDMLIPYSQLAPWLATGGVALLLATIILYALAEQKLIWGYCCLGLAGLIAALSGLHGASSLAAFNSAGPWVASWQGQIQDHSRIFSINTYDQTLDFYLDRTVTLVNFEDELGFGLKQEPHRSIPDIKDFLNTWGTQPGDIAIFEIGQMAPLKEAGMPMHVLAQSTRHVVVSFK
jgi:4-amino-4-deoxy-L-arabinose transferase-like glycosyltransferase